MNYWWGVCNGDRECLFLLMVDGWLFRHFQPWGANERSLTDRLNDTVLCSNKGGQRRSTWFLDFHSHLCDLMDHHKSCIYIFVSWFVSFGISNASLCIPCCFSEHFITSAEESIQSACYPSWSASLILLMKIRCRSQWRAGTEVKLKTSPSLVFRWKQQKFECFTTSQCALCLRKAEKADITSAWLEKRQKRRMWMRGRARAGGQVRPESRLCVAAGSRNTTFHCGTHRYTHTYCTCWRYWRGCLAMKKKKTLKTVTRWLVQQRQRSDPSLTDFQKESLPLSSASRATFFQISIFLFRLTLTASGSNRAWRTCECDVPSVENAANISLKWSICKVWVGFINLVVDLKVPSVTFGEIVIITTVIVRWDDISNSSKVIEVVLVSFKGYVQKIP